MVVVEPQPEATARDGRVGQDVGDGACARPAGRMVSAWRKSSTSPAGRRGALVHLPRPPPFRRQDDPGAVRRARSRAVPSLLPPSTTTISTSGPERRRGIEVAAMLPASWKVGTMIESVMAGAGGLRGRSNGKRSWCETLSSGGYEPAGRRLDADLADPSARIEIRAEEQVPEHDVDAVVARFLRADAVVEMMDVRRGDQIVEEAGAGVDVGVRQIADDEAERPRR